MDHVELDSFIKKFKSLWLSGYDASLNIESKLGDVQVSLSCKVGRPAPPPLPTTPHYMFCDSGQKARRSPSYYRRQVRRRTSCDLQSAMRNAADQAEEIDDQCVIEETGEDDTEPVEESVAEAENATNNRTLEGTEETCVESTEEVDRAELERDKIIQEVIVSAVTKPVESVEDVEKEIKDRFSSIGVEIFKIDSYSNSRGKFSQSRVKTSPVNLKDIWGRRLGLRNCSVIEYFPPPFK